MLTALTGTSFATGIFKFAIHLNQADVNDDEEIGKAGDDLVKVILDAIGLGLGVVGAFKFVPRLLQTLKLFKVVRNIDEFKAVTGFLGKFGQNEKLGKLLEEADEAGLRYLVDLASHLGRKSEGVADVLSKSSKTLDELLSKGIDEAEALLDSIDEILKIPGALPELVSDFLKRGLSPLQIKASAKALEDAGYRFNSALEILKIAEEQQVIIRTRPTNPEAPRLRDEGFAAKPLFVKAKSINEYDTYIGASSEDLGKVGYFEPRLDSDALNQLDPQIRAEVMNRFEQRRTEYGNSDLAKSMAEKVNDGSIRIENGLVINNRQGTLGFGKPFTGDIDTFDILSPNGQPVSLEKQLQVMDKLQNRVNSDITHNHHMDPNWNPTKQYEIDIRQKIIQQHTFGTPGAEALVEYRPNGTVGRSYYGNETSPLVPY